MHVSLRHKENSEKHMRRSRDAHLLVTVALSDMAEIQEGTLRAVAESWDSERDLNQGTNLIMESLENRLGSMRSVVVGTEARDHNDITFLERSTNCLDHILHGNRLKPEFCDCDLGFNVG